ncbi:unnamed protein product, partial [Ectocarpus sp. 8 AP-2014]
MERGLGKPRPRAQDNLVILVLEYEREQERGLSWRLRAIYAVTRTKIKFTTTGASNGGRHRSTQTDRQTETDRWLQNVRETRQYYGRAEATPILLGDVIMGKRAELAGC